MVLTGHMVQDSLSQAKPESKLSYSSESCQIITKSHKLQLENPDSQ